MGITREIKLEESPLGFRFIATADADKAGRIGTPWMATVEAAIEWFRANA